MKAYSFQNCVVLVNGVEITNWSDGDDVLDIKRRKNSIEDKVGADGKMMMTIGSDKSGSFTFKLQATSPSNKFLGAIQSLGEAGAQTFVPVTVQFLDTYRNDMSIGTVGYITKPADIKRGASAGDTEWEIVVENLNTLLGDAADILAGA